MTFITKNTLNIFLLSFFCLSSCSENHSSYFPLDKIKSWNYKIEVGPGISDVETTGEIRALYKRNYHSLKKITIQSDSKKLITNPILRDDGTIFYYQTSDNGVIRNGTQFIGSKKINLEKERRAVLPYPLKIGKKWSINSQTFLIKRRYPWYGYGVVTNFQLNYEIISKNHTVDTPFGKIKNCLFIRGKGETTFVRESEVGTIKIKILSEEWYAKGIGLIRTIRTEKTDTELFGTTKMTQSLENYKKK